MVVRVDRRVGAVALGLGSESPDEQAPDEPAGRREQQHDERSQRPVAVSEQRGLAERAADD